MAEGTVALVVDIGAVLGASVGRVRSLAGVA
jgi:hypothetical protein